jgi:hypothetical protein
MHIRFLNVFRSSLALTVLLSMQGLVFPLPSLAQDEGITFEQAQTRTNFARKQMQASRRDLKEAEGREETALSALAEVRKRQEEAQKTADQSTEERQGAEKKYQEARDKWSRESERLIRIHQRRNTNSSAR